MAASSYSEATVSNSPAFTLTHAHGSNATLTFDFGTQVTDPVLHIGRIGYYSGDPSRSHSSSVELNGGVTWTKLAANDVHFVTTSTAVWRETGTTLDWRKTGGIGGPTWGTAAGSMRVNGTFSSIALTIGNAEPMGSVDQIEFVWTGLEAPPPSPPANSCGAITATKTVSASTVGVGGSVDWYLNGTNTGPLDISNAVWHDELAPELSATALFPGRWTPATTEARIEIYVSGAWLLVGTFDGTPVGSYSLPAGVEEIRAVFISNVDQSFTMEEPISLTTEIIQPDRDGVSYSLPANVQNCVSWNGDNMAYEEQCATVAVLENSADPTFRSGASQRGCHQGASRRSGYVSRTIGPRPQI